MKSASASHERDEKIEGLLLNLRGFGHSCRQARRALDFPLMSTLGEIEEAVKALSLEQKQELLRFLASRVNGEGPAKNLGNLSDFAGSIRLPEDPLAWQQRARGEWE